MATLADRVKDLRTEKGWTMAEVARFVGCTVPNISHIEAGRVTDPRRPTLRSLARLFGVTESYLKGGDE